MLLKIYGNPIHRGWQHGDDRPVRHLQHNESVHDQEDDRAQDGALVHQGWEELHAHGHCHWTFGVALQHQTDILKVSITVFFKLPVNL